MKNRADSRQFLRNTVDNKLVCYISTKTGTKQYDHCSMADVHLYVQNVHYIVRYSTYCNAMLQCNFCSAVMYIHTVSCGHIGAIEFYSE